MKKILLFVLGVAFVGAVFTSCKTHETCPAYGKVKVKNTEKI